MAAAPAATSRPSCARLPLEALAARLMLLLAMAPFAAGHGMLIQPPNRVSMWRYGYDTPVNYDDDGQYCGGAKAHWGQNGGKCGECGDDWSLPRPRPAENGGKFGTGTIAGKYQEGQVIETVTRITVNHWGHFQYRLCPLSKPGELETEQCFQQHPLDVVDGGGSSDAYRLPSHEAKDYPVRVRLPAGVTCKQCVLQWTYTVANSWGSCANGTEGIGCGPQETFRTCSDISIV